MSAARSLWRALVAALQVVALVAFMMPGPGHVHAGAPDQRVAALGLDAGDAQVESGGPSGRAEAGYDAPDAPDRQTSSPGHVPCSCGCGCNCQSALTDAAGAASSPWIGRSAALPRLVERAFATLAPEALPEPPRSFA